MARLLIADDHVPLLQGVQRFLAARGHDVVLSSSIPELRGVLEAERFDVVMLDRNFPSGDALDVCRDMRAHEDDTPVIIVSARTSVDEIVEGLHAGADDYIGKPLQLPILEARLTALLRRRLDVRLEAGPFSLSRLHSTVVIDRARTVRLSDREAKLLRMLAERPGETLGRDELLGRLWTDPLSLTDNALDALVSRLRRRLRPHGDHVETVRGRGFRLRI